ncbi:MULTISPECIES: hypothetical protein [Enterobacterales]|uniref:Uncharacterized protein n=1 Tax=Morganella morganii TaxID=582 RepID=A0AAI9HVL4_MORMO|nr:MULTISPECIES: hypothetical protein [Enterobacterales]EKW8762986.1 hypothetical protein [Morganella morganii]ELR5042081.1 hypothetical protein [Providencia stuartii]EKU6781529.1 hypothetical protein [Proteus mirabilis]ELB1134754.1 hypothetical protein [Proteus mirabilis]ELB1135619.1 hypothetical protein [Proteus mirabilis]
MVSGWWGKGAPSTIKSVYPHFKDESKIASLKHSYTHGEKVSPLLVSVVIVDGLPKLAVMDGFQRYCALMEIVAEGGQIEGVDVKEA